MTEPFCQRCITNHVDDPNVCIANLGNYPLAVGSRLGYAPPREREENIPVTVCVAAISLDSMIFGASDRMITADDIQFEPSQRKIGFLTKSIATMISGHSPLQTEILYNVSAEVDRRVEAEPENWLRVVDVAELYQKHYQEAKSKRIANTYLAPLGLDSQTFIDRQRLLSPELVTKLATEMIDFGLPSMSVIVTGVDGTGPHIYVVSNGEIFCQDSVGFAAIGAGMWHANSQFMFEGHTRGKPDDETLWLTYYAKKRSETAPGVGEGTDMFFIGPGTGVSGHVWENIVTDLEKFYQETRVEETKLMDSAKEKVKQYVGQLGKTAAEEQEVQDEDGDKPAN